MSIKNINIIFLISSLVSIASVQAEEICKLKMSSIALMRKSGVSEDGVIYFKPLDADGDGFDDNISLSCSGSASYYPPDPCALRWTNPEGMMSTYFAASAYVVENKGKIYFVIRDYPEKENGSDPGISLYSMVSGNLKRECLLEKGKIK